ncbi:MAG: hypothetical protein K8T90_05745, partial [Planctomycetes bacterium]|nr:hypothetical protein [Planctomycetota bacterium]
ADSADAALAIFRRLAPSHAPLDGTRAASCVHAGYRGTVSSSLIALADRGPSTFVYADGAPCVAKYVDALRG